MYKNIIFDVYGTMIDIITDEYDEQTWKSIEPLFAFYGVDCNANQLKAMFFVGCNKQLEQNKQKFDYPEIDVTKVFYDILDSQGKANKQNAKCLAQAFRAASMRKFRLFEGVLQTLARLKKAGKKLYVLSNAQSVFTAQELKNCNLTKLFKGVALSSNYGVAKPSTKFFDLVCNKYKLNKEECLYVGNDPHTDVFGANNAGMHCIWLNTGHLANDTPHTPTYTVGDGNFCKIADIVLQ